MKNITKVMAMTLILACNNLYVSDNYSQDMIHRLEKQYRVGQTLIENIYKKKNKLAEKGSRSRIEHPAFYELLDCISGDLRVYSNENASIEEKTRAMSFILKVTLCQLDEKTIEFQDACKAEELASINSHSNILRKSAAQQTKTQVPQIVVKPKELLTTTREQRRTAQKEAAKAAKKAAKTIK